MLHALDDVVDVDEKGIMGVDGMQDDANKFNRAINVGNELALWFKEEFSSTNCRDICKADFFTREGVDAYLVSHGIERCRAIANEVALKSRAIFQAPRSRSKHLKEGL